MALNYDLSKINNYKALCEGDGLNTISETLILYSMSVGLNTLSQKNVDEWYFRLKALEVLHRPAFTKVCDKCEGKGGLESMGGGAQGCSNCDNGAIHFDFDYADVCRMIGLTTNAPQLTRAQFLANCKRNLEDKAMRKARCGKETFERNLVKGA